MKISQLIEHLQQGYDPDAVVAYDLWTVDDVMHEANDVTVEQAEEVLGRMQRHKDCTIGMNWDVLDYHRSEVLREADTGPPYPQDGVLNLTDDQFIARYKPEKNEQGGYYRQRDWTIPEDQVEIEKATAEHRIWTAGDDDDGNFCISSGWHYVNRLFYIITELPLENPDWIVQVPSDDDDQDAESEVYILWESSGNVETFDSEDEAKDELMAAESRGLRGLIYRDKADAFSDAQDRWEAIKAAQIKD